MYRKTDETTNNEQRTNKTMGRYVCMCKACFLLLILNVGSVVRANLIVFGPIWPLLVDPIMLASSAKTTKANSNNWLWHTYTNACIFMHTYNILKHKMKALIASLKMQSSAFIIYFYFFLYLVRQTAVKLRQVIYAPNNETPINMQIARMTREFRTAIIKLVCA